MASERRTQADRRRISEEKLITAAITIIAKQGYGGLRLVDLGQKAGVSRGLATHYFGNKENLLKKVIDVIFSRTTKSVEDNNSPELNELDIIFFRIFAYVNRWKTATTDGKALLAIFAAAASDVAAETAVLRHNKLVVTWFEERLEEAIKAGLAPASLDVKIEAQHILAFLRGLGTLVLTDKSFDAKRIAGTFVEGLKVRYRC